MAGQAGQRVGGGQRIQIAHIQCGAVRQVGHVSKRGLRARLHDALSGRFGQALD